MRMPIWALLVLAALVGGFLLGGATAKDGSLFGQTVAAWIQAIGGVAAIVASAWIAIQIDRNAANRREFEISLQAGIDNSAGRRAVITARNMLQSVVRDLRLLRPIEDPNFDQRRRWARRLTVASEQLAFHVERGRIEADVAFAAIYARQEIIEMLAGVNELGARQPWQPWAARADAAIAAINGVIEELDEGVLGL